MYFDIMNGYSFYVILSHILSALFIVFIVFPIHNNIQAYLTLKLGDTSQNKVEIISINPLRHIDVAGGICVLLFGFGWTNLFPINYKHYKRKRFKYMTYITLAGYAVYFFFALAAIVGAGLLMKFTDFTFSYPLYKGNTPVIDFSSNESIGLLIFGSFLLSVAVGLVMTLVINIIPLPPFDAYRFLRPLFTKDLSELFKSFIPVIELLILCVCIMRFTEYVTNPITSFCLKLVEFI